MSPGVFLVASEVMGGGGGGIAGGLWRKAPLSPPEK